MRDRLTFPASSKDFAFIRVEFHVPHLLQKLIELAFQDHFQECMSLARS